MPGLFGTSHGALQFMAYEELKRDYNKYRSRASEEKLVSEQCVELTVHCVLCVCMFAIIAL